MSLFPIVPKVPGVPPLLRDPLAAAAGIITLMAGDAISTIISLFGPQWGIFQNGFPIIAAESVLSVDYKKDWNLANYPIEQGAFETYNKVEQPFASRLRFATGGSIFERQQFLDSIEAVAGDMETYDVVTPERVYKGVNITHVDYRRNATNGVGLLTVDVWVQELRQGAEPAFSSTAEAPGGDAHNGGTVQPSETDDPPQIDEVS